MFDINVVLMLPWWTDVTIVQSDVTIVVLWQLSKVSKHDYLFGYCPLAGILFEALTMLMRPQCITAYVHKGDYRYGNTHCWSNTLLRDISQKYMEVKGTWIHFPVCHLPWEVPHGCTIHVWNLDIVVRQTRPS